MFNWLRKRPSNDRPAAAPDKLAARPTAAPHAVSAPAPVATATRPSAATPTVSAPEAVDAPDTIPAHLQDLAFTVPAALHEMANTVPASPELPGEAASAAAPSALAWMLGIAPPDPAMGTTLAERETALLQRLDAALAAPRLPDKLLPRAPAVVPQILALLRKDDVSRSELAAQVQRDVLLTAEVLRVAQGALHGSRPVSRLEDALDRIGRFGLQCAMTRVLMKPVFQAQAGGLTARAAARIWLYAESKSMFCAELAGPAQVDRFDAFLAGLVHDSGWLALLRLGDQLGVGLPQALSPALDAELAARKERLFGRLTADWDLTSGLTALSQELAHGDAAAEPSALRELLRAADRLCLAHVSEATAA